MRGKLLCTVAALSLLALAPLTLANGPEAAAKDDGKELYAKKCAMCHGVDGVAKAMAKGSANFNDPAWQAKATNDAIAAVTRDGKNKMPKFGDKLTPEQIQAIVTHVRTLKTQE